MKKKILLISESLTVQKVVSLTLPREGYQLFVAKSRSEAIHLVLDHLPDMILVSDQVSDINVSSFPKEVEAWLGLQPHKVSVVLITSETDGPFRAYHAVLKKPFTPDQLIAVLTRFVPVDPNAPAQESEGTEDSSLEKMFNNTFSDEDQLVNQTLAAENDFDNDAPTLINIPNQFQGEVTMDNQGHWEEGVKRVTPPGKKQDSQALWDKGSVPVMSANDSMAFKSSLENQVRQKLESTDLENMVSKVLEEMLPPIVEKMVERRLNDLLGEQESHP